MSSCCCCKRALCFFVVVAKRCTEHCVPNSRKSNSDCRLLEDTERQVTSLAWKLAVRQAAPCGYLSWCHRTPWTCASHRVRRCKSQVQSLGTERPRAAVSQSKSQMDHELVWMPVQALARGLKRAPPPPWTLAPWALPPPPPLSSRGITPCASSYPSNPTLPSLPPSVARHNLLPAPVSQGVCKPPPPFQGLCEAPPQATLLCVLPLCTPSVLPPRRTEPTERAAGPCLERRRWAAERRSRRERAVRRRRRQQAAAAQGAGTPPADRGQLLPGALTI